MTEAVKTEARPLVLHCVETVLNWMIAFALAVMAVVTFFDVLGRYFLAAPIPGAFQLSEFAMGLMVFAAIPILCGREKHITIDLASGLFRGIARRIRSTLVNLACTVIMGVLAARLLVLGLRYTEMGDTTMMLSIPLAPFAYAMFGFTTLATVALAARTFLHAAGRAIDPPRFDAP